MVKEMSTKELAFGNGGKQMKKENDFKYEVKAKLGDLSEKKELRVIAWSDNEPCLDLRNWWLDKSGNEKCGKGITLTDDEAKKLMELLTEYFKEVEE